MIVFSSTLKNNLKDLKDVYDRLQVEGLKLIPRKCDFAKTEVGYLRHVISNNGLKPNPKKLDAIHS